MPLYTGIAVRTTETAVGKYGADNLEQARERCLELALDMKGTQVNCEVLVREVQGEA